MSRWIPERTLSPKGMLALAALALVAIGGCGDVTDSNAPERTSDAPSPSSRSTSGTLGPLDDAARPQVRYTDTEALEAAFEDDILVLAAEEPLRQVGFMFDAPTSDILRWRPAGSEAPWQPVEVTWSESGAHVGRIFLDRPTDAIALRRKGRITSLVAEFYAEIVADRRGPLTRELPFVDSDTDAEPPSGGAPSPDGYRTRRQKEAPRSLVIPREKWGARHPNKKCGRPHNPYRMTIHHTASPSNDGGDPAKRMRQMQAFHIDSRGWCDIGYHFVVSQSGKVYQGRSTEKRTGAHVGGENTGNIGISLIGNFEHQTVQPVQFKETTRIVHWVHTTYSIPLNRSKLKGHTEWPGQNTACPGQNLRSRLQELVNRSKNPGGGSSYDITIDTTVEGLDNPYATGNSASIDDAFPGETFRADIRVTNNSSSAIRDVWLGYAFQTPYLTATSYTIYTDAPAKDQSNWMVNDSDSAPKNPPKSKMGADGKLDLYAFAAGETKRIVVDLEAGPYSVGELRHPDVRAWVRRIEGVYETQTSWKDSVATNKVGRTLRDAGEIDILSRRQWHFDDTAHPKNLEGWTACCGTAYEELAVNQNDGALAVEISGRQARLEAPAWTRIDADRFDQMVIRMRSHDGPHDVALWWATDQQMLTDARALQFRAKGNGDFVDYVVPLTDASPAVRWSGEVVKLRIAPLYEEAPESQASGWYDIDRIFFQSSTERTTNTARTDFVDAPPVQAHPLVSPDDDEPDTGPPPVPDTGPDTGTARPDAAPSPDTSATGGLTHRAAASNIRVNEGCHAAGPPAGRPDDRSAPAPLGMVVWFLALGLGVSRRARR